MFLEESVQTGVAKNLTDKNKILEPFFEIKVFDMKKKTSKNKSHHYNQDSTNEETLNDYGYLDYQVPGVVTSDIDTFVREVIERRGFNPGIVKVCCGLDNGQKYNKIQSLSTMFRIAAQRELKNYSRALSRTRVCINQEIELMLPSRLLQQNLSCLINFHLI